MKTHIACSFLLLWLGFITAHAAPDDQPQTIPFDQLGAEAQKKYSGDGITITPMADGARLKAVMQDLEAEATRDGLWLPSTAACGQTAAQSPNPQREQYLEASRQLDQQAAALGTR